MNGTVDLLHRVARATVTVAATIPESHPSVGVLGDSRFGTGTLVDPTGLVLTVNYVVLGADSVRLTDVEGRHHDAVVMAQDFASGVAVVKAESGTLPHAAVGGSAGLAVGDQVFSVSSLGTGERRSASGTVTSLEPFDAYWEYRLERAIWSTCPNPGLGGAPLCDRRGRVVGVVSLNLGALARATLAIPSENYFEHAAELLEHGRRISRPRRAWLGMFCYALPDRTVVAGLVPGAPAERCGVRVGDVILRIDGQQVTGRHQLYDRIWTHGPGESVELHLYRDGRLATVEVESCDAEEFFRL